MLQTSSLLIHQRHHAAITNHGGCYSMETLGNISISSAHGHCSVVTLSCNQWKAHHEIPHTREHIEYNTIKFCWLINFATNLAHVNI